MNKDFDNWNTKKKSTDVERTIPIFYEREVCWAKVGLNIGVEIDGKEELFLRPVVIARKFNMHMAFVVPVTSQDKEGNIYYFDVDSEDKKIYKTCLSQARTISSKRLFRKIGTIRHQAYDSLLNKLSAMIYGKLK